MGSSHSQFQPLFYLLVVLEWCEFKELIIFAFNSLVVKLVNQKGRYFDVNRPVCTGLFLVGIQQDLPQCGVSVTRYVSKF